MRIFHSLREYLRRDTNERKTTFNNTSDIYGSHDPSVYYYKEHRTLIAAFINETFKNCLYLSFTVYSL